MVEVFKTDVKDRGTANLLIKQIHQTYTGYTANFDLDDCDNILRVKSVFGNVQADPLILLLEKYGFKAEVLPD